MNKLIFAFIFIILFINVYTSTDESKSNENLSCEDSTSSTELTEDDCKNLSTVDDTIYECSFNSENHSCFVTNKSECEKNTKTKTSRRMLSSTELTENKCKNMNTSNDTIYICTVSSDKKSCEQKPKPQSECYLKKSSSKLNPVLIEEDCEDLNTSDNTAYICALRDDEVSCFEKVNSNYLKLATALFLCLFLFI